MKRHVQIVDSAEGVADESETHGLVRMLEETINIFNGINDKLVKHKVDVSYSIKNIEDLVDNNPKDMVNCGVCIELTLNDVKQTIETSYVSQPTTACN